MVPADTWRYTHTRIAELRQRRDLSQEELAERAELPLRTVARLDRGEIRNPSIRSLLAVARALDCSLEDLIEPEWRES